jgi:hypothetical protein
MPSEETVLTCLQSVLCNHRERGTLLEKTPRELRIEVAQSLGLNAQDIDKHKDALKAEISKYISQMGPPKIEKKLMKLRSPKPEIRKLKERMNRRRVKPASPSSDSSSSASSSDDSDSRPITPASMRSLAKMLGVPPSFWQELDKNDISQMRIKLLDFCESKDVPRADTKDLPTKREAITYKRDRELKAELEGIRSTNIITSKRRRFTGLLL